MLCLQKSYLLNSRRDLVSKLNIYKNINQISSIKFLNLNFSEIKGKSTVILGLGFLYLLTGKKGKIMSNSRSFFSKNMYCNLHLKKGESLDFIEKFLSLNLKNILDLEEGFSKKNLSETGTFSFTIKDIYIFSELEDNLFKFRNLKNLNVSISFESSNKYENILLLQSLGFLFKN